MAAGTYLLTAGMVALATPVLGGKEPAIIVWLVGGLLFFAAALVFAVRSMPMMSVPRRFAGALLIALGGASVIAAIGFVLMVNIWERLGLGH